MPRIRGNALRALVQPDSQPVSSHVEAFVEQLGPVCDCHRNDDTSGSGSKRETDVVGPLHAPGDLEWHCHSRRHAAKGVEIGRATRGSVHVDDVDHLRASRHEPLGDPFRPIGGGADAGGGSRPVDDA